MESFSKRRKKSAHCIGHTASSIAQEFQELYCKSGVSWQTIWDNKYIYSWHTKLHYFNWIYTTHWTPPDRVLGATKRFSWHAFHCLVCACWQVKCQKLSYVRRYGHTWCFRLATNIITLISSITCHKSQYHDL